MKTMTMAKKDGVYTKKKNEVYTIRLLEDKEFDKLPYEGIKDSLGFADPESGDAFVRKTGVKDWDMATIQHEIDELLSQKSFHEDAQGIRHKKFFKEVGIPILATLAGSMIGAPYLGALGAPLGAAAGSAIQQQVQHGRIDPLQTGLAALGGYTGGPGIKAGYAGAKAAGKGILGTVGAGIKGAFTGGPAAAPLQGPVTAAQSAKGFTSLGQVPAGMLGSQAARTITPAESLFGRITGSLKTGADISAIPSTVGQPFGAGGLLAAATPGVTTVGGAGGGVGAIAKAPEGILGKATELLKDPQKLLGAGSLLTSTIPKTPQFEMPPSVSKLEEAFVNQGGLTELSQTARGKLLETIRANPADLRSPVDNAFIEASLRGARESYDAAQEQIDANFNLTGTFGSGEHQVVKADLEEEYAQLRSDFIALENNKREEAARLEQQQAVITALQDAGFTEANIMEIVALDVQAAATKYGSDVASMQAIKEALAGLGKELLTGGFQPQTQ